MLAAMIVLTIAAACAQQPPVTTAATTDDDIGRFVWQDLMTDDVDGAMSFYGSLLGWEFEETSRLGERYVLVRSDNRYVAGIAHVERDDPDEPIAQWISYISVADVDRAAEQVRQAGGEVLAGPLDVNITRVAIVTDPQGAPLGLATMPATLNADAVQSLEAGVFIWRDYLAADVEEALTFYRDLAGFDSERVPRTDDIVHYALQRGEPRAGLFAIGDEPIKPNWVTYVRVDDPGALAERAEALGGQVILEPRADLRNGSLAIVADPSGAALALQRWPIDPTEES